MASNWNTGEVYHLVTDESTGEAGISLFLRKLKSGNRYYARFCVDRPELAKGQRYVTKSLKTDNLDEARSRAFQYFYEIKGRQSAGTPIKSISVLEAIEKFVNDYREKLGGGVTGYSDHTLRALNKTLRPYWAVYIGPKALETVSHVDLEDYEAWRRQYARDPNRKKKTQGNYKTEITSRTVEWEIGYFKQVLRWHAGRNAYPGTAYAWKYKINERNRRSAFTESELKKLHRHLNSEEYLRVGKHKNDSRLERHRHLLKAYILFMLNTGLRVGEARNLKWRDIEKKGNKHRVRVPLIQVSASSSKTRRKRITVGTNAALRALEAWESYYAELGEPPWEYVFCNEKGDPIGDFRAGFRKVLEDAKISEDANGERHTIYTLRHTYITQSLIHRQNLSIHALALNCGTSVDMIERYYSDVIPSDHLDNLTIDHDHFEELASLTPFQKKVGKRIAPKDF